MKNDTLEENLTYIFYLKCKYIPWYKKIYQSDIDNNLNAQSNQGNVKLLKSWHLWGYKLYNILYIKSYRYKCNHNHE